MANNQYVNKIIFGDQTLIDLTQDTVAAANMLNGTTAHNAAGASISGTIPTKTASNIMYDWNDAGQFYITTPSGYYATDITDIWAGLVIDAPESGTRAFTVYVPSNAEHTYIPLTIEVDSQGNSNITDNTIPASGVSF